MGWVFSRALTSMMILGGVVASTAAAAQVRGSRETRDFVQAAAQTDQFEILEAQTALTGSSNPEVRAFAREMLLDHMKTSEALEAATMKSGLAPPPKGISADQAALLGALQSLRGQDFDRAYLTHQTLIHRSALIVEQAYASSGDDAAVQQAAKAAITLISAHLDMAERLRTRAGG